MDIAIEAMIKMLEETGAGLLSVTLGKYTIMITDDEEGAKHLADAWDSYVEEAEQDGEE